MANAQFSFALLILGTLLRGSLAATISPLGITGASGVTGATGATNGATGTVTVAVTETASTTTTSPTTTSTTTTTTSTTTTTTTTTTTPTTTTTTTTTTTPTTPTTTTTTTTTTTSTTTPSTTTTTTTTEAPTTKAATTTKATTTTTTTTEEPTTTTKLATTTTAAVTMTTASTTTTAASTTTTTAAVAEITTKKVCDVKVCTPVNDKMFNLTTCQCECIYKINPSDTKSYVVRRPGFPDYFMPCPAGLEYSTSLCHCSYPKTPETAVAASAAAPVATTNCLSTISYEFDKTDGTFLDGTNYLEFENAVSQIQVDDVVGATVVDKAINMINNSISIDYVRGNDLTHTAYIETRVKPTEDHDNVSRVIISNGCYNGGTVQVPSLLVAFNAAEQQFNVTVRTGVTSRGTCDSVIDPDLNGWYKIAVAVKNSDTTVTVNGEHCTSFTGSGSIQRTQCALTIGGNPFRWDYKEDFNGYLDYLKVVKHCDHDIA